MKLKNIAINSLLFLGAIYIPLFIFSAFNYFFLTPKDKYNQIKIDRLINEDFPQKISAIKSGFYSTYPPKEILKIQKKPAVYPIGSLPETLTYLCNEGYGLITFKTDRFGLRNSDKKWENIFSKTNIFVIGDSFIEGACVPEEFTIPNIIEKRVGINTINLGTGGNGPYEYLAILKSIISPIIEKSNKENIVIINFYINDKISLNSKKEDLLSATNSILNITPEGNVEPKNIYKKNIKDFIKKNFNQSNKERILKIKKIEYDLLNPGYKNSFSYYVLTLVPIRSRLTELLKSTNQTNEPHKSTILTLSEICKNKCRPIISYIPNSNYWRPQRSNQYKNQLKLITERMGILFIDGEKAINRNDLNDYAPKGGHLSKEGYKKMANLISDRIKF